MKPSKAFYFSKVLLIITIISFYSCSKQAEFEDPYSQLDAVTKQAITIGNTAEIKQAYILLNLEQKQKLWEIKLETILKNDDKQLTVNQKSIILGLQRLLNKGIENLINEPNVGDKFIKTNYDFLKQNFDVYQLYLLIECPYFCEKFSLLNAKSYLTTIDQKKSTISGDLIKPLVLLNPDCNCRYDVYCSRQNDKSVCMDGDSNCVEVTGCGLFGTSNCTGRCK